MRRIWIRENGQRTLIVEENEKPVELLLINEDGASGSVYLGKVDRIAIGLKAAFVDFGESKDGFLPLEENSKTFTGKPLKNGMIVPVQIRREAHGDKGAFLSRDLVFSGEFLMLMPMNHHIGISARITDVVQRERLYDIGKELTENNGGIVIRSSAETADIDSLRSEWLKLTAEWNRLEEKLREKNQVGPVGWNGSELNQLLKDYSHRGIDRVYTDSRIIYDALSPRFCCEIVSEEEMRAKCRSVRRQALKRVVELPHGGNIYIDRCEALTVIDVNTASDIRSGNRDVNGFLSTDLEACDEIVRQIRLRNLSGMILIDMIDNMDEESRYRIIERLGERLKEDRIKTVVHGITDLGLVEITRRRTGKTVYDMWTIPCPHCKGTGAVVKLREEEE